ncbi:MAG: hypothetical protein AAFN74_24490, partial [Myxococcota bacterium]
MDTTIKRLNSADLGRRGPEPGGRVRKVGRRFALALALVVPVLSSCESSQLNRLEARLLAFDPRVPAAERPSDGLTALDFGDVPVGVSELRPLGIRSAGTDTLVVCVPGNQLATCASDTGIVPSDAPFSIRFENTDANTGGWIV